MNPFRWLTLRLRAVLGRRALERDMQQEIRDHLEQATERLRARGMSPKDARLAAQREFGNLTMVEEAARDARAARWVEALVGDMQFAFRYFARHKATVTIIVAVLALGTGANTVIFSIFQGEFRRPPPGITSDKGHARFWALQRATRTAQWQPRGFTHTELLSFAERREIFSAVAGWTAHDVVLGGADSTIARAVRGQFVTPNFFTALSVPLAAGQGFAQDPTGTADMTAVLAWNFAVQLHGSAANAIGRRILVNEIPLHVVGVAPPRFQGAFRNMNEPALWIPVSARADVARISPRWLTDQPALDVFARLAPGASFDQATALAQHVIATGLPDSAARVGMARVAHVLRPHQRPPEIGWNNMILGLMAITIIGILILLVAWMNVSSLMVAAAVGRRHEIAVRISLGASRVRLLRQLVTESTLLALAGSAVGLSLAWWVLAWNARTEVDLSITPDLGTFVFVLAMALATGILFGLSPALHATRGAVSSALRDSRTGTSSRARLQRGFVVAQIMLSQPLLVVLGMLLSLVIADYRPFSPETSRHVIAVGLRPLMRTGAPGQRFEAVDSLVPRIAGRPDVQGAVPDATGFDVRGVIAGDRPVTNAEMGSAPTIVGVEGATPGWFSLLDLPIVLGRDVAWADTAAADRPVVIGTDLARLVFGDANPVGRTLASAAVLPGQDSIALTVVGVYDANRRLPGGETYDGYAARGTPTPRVFTAHGKHWRRDRVLVRPRGPAEPFISELRRFIRAEAPSLPFSSMLTLAQEDEVEYRATLKESMAAGAGGVLALLLASLGLYGVVSLAVQQRTREIGIRIAVGAHPTRVTRMFLASGVRLSVIALLLGLPLSVAGLRIAMSQGLLIAPQVNPYLIGAVIAVLLLAVASAATWMPARRAARVDPAITLRVE